MEGRQKKTKTKKQTDDKGKERDTVKHHKLAHHTARTTTLELEPSAQRSYSSQTRDRAGGGGRAERPPPGTARVLPTNEGTTPPVGSQQIHREYSQRQGTQVDYTN